MIVLMLKKPSQVCVCVYVCRCRLKQKGVECNYVFIVKREKQTHLHRSIHLDYCLSVACLTNMMTILRLSISEMALSHVLHSLIFSAILRKSSKSILSHHADFVCSDLTHGQGQFYQLKPYDISAPIGANLTIPCVIAPPHGDVQWTKDGLALGRSSVNRPVSLTASSSSSSMRQTSEVYT